MGLIDELNGGTVVLGGLLGAALVLPAIYATKAFVGPDPGVDSNAWVIPVLAIFLAFPVVGFWAARRQPATPLLHATAAAGLAALAMLAHPLISRITAGGLGGAAVVTSLLVIQISVSLSLVGAWLSGRRKERPS